MMKVYVFPLAPNGAKVRIYLAEKTQGGAEIELEEITVNLLEGEQNKPDYLAINPMGAIPSLALEDGRVLHESLAIIDYLEELHPGSVDVGPRPIRTGVRAPGRADR